MSLDEKSNIKHRGEVLDWEELRIKSLKKGGFGEERVEVWPRLLNVKKEKFSPILDEKLSLDEETSHKDERQIGLDTDRSFVLYPVEPKIDRESMQADLNRLLVSLFRKRPRLSYFQLVCVEKLSLHRLRDSMGSGLEPVLGLLRITKNLLRLADPEFAEVLESNSPLPFYALSNLLTLFSHDIPTLPLIQHVFDFLLCRPPIAAVYLAAAIILSRKKEVLRLEEEDEDGMVHSLLSSFPNLVDDIQDLEQGDNISSFTKSENFLEDDDNTFFIDERDTKPIELVSSTISPLEPIYKPDPDSVDEALAGDRHTISDPAQRPDILRESSLSPPTETDNREEISEKVETDGNSLPEAPHPADMSASLSPTRDVQLPSSSGVLDGPSRSLSSLSAENSQEMDNRATVSEPTSAAHSQIVTDHDHEDPSQTERATVPSVKLFLTDLLRHADELYKEFPLPIQGCHSLPSWAAKRSVHLVRVACGLPSDNMAEAMVARPELVVYPFVEEAEKAEREAYLLPKKNKRRESKSKSAPGKTYRKRRRLKKSLPFGHMENKTILAGTVLVLGVAMAVYGIKTRSTSHSGGGVPFFGYEGRTAATAAAAAGGSSGSGSGAKELKKLGGWIGGTLVGMSEKIINGLTPSSGAGHPS
ncbi:hypothetical protein CPB84DRAFT_1852349 [Gymnopilus junonius]|uniref:Rab-GAP TBC domain-containing protein n=1 Tax=Gymnopilus junonius TaxID=109634 RepID=A0A9P5NE64_GYMJU|nr:hypothetical protein CPB84DRAFT_1852349 [Gymnopilus junonius]